MKINRSQIMKRAHEIAKTLVGDWYARLALALRQAWMEAKTIVTKAIETAAKVKCGLTGVVVTECYEIKDTLKIAGFYYLDKTWRMDTPQEIIKTKDQEKGMAFLAAGLKKAIAAGAKPAGDQVTQYVLTLI